MNSKIMPKNKILFVIRTADQFIYYKSIVEALLDHGCLVRLLYDLKWTGKPDSLKSLEMFGRERGNFEFGAIAHHTGKWRKVLFCARETLSYRSYLLGERKKLRKFYQDRWKSYLPKILQNLFEYKIPRLALASAPSGWFLRTFEKIFSADKKIFSDIKKYSPDVVFASPGNMRFSSADLEYLKAAKALAIPTAVSVVSWDNLTNKGLFHIFPDRLLVWNEEDKKEAIVHHGIPESSIKIIGAPLFDQWFTELKPSQTREEFCHKNGLRGADPIITYLGSSLNVAQDESWVVEEIRGAFDKDPLLKKAQIIIRPYPANKKIYKRLNLHSTIILPKEGGLPSSKETLNLFLDTLYFSVCTVGINTSGMIDAIIAGKPGMVFMPEKYKSSQMETKHFQHIFNSGALEGVKDGSECAAAIRHLIGGRDERKENRIAFIEHFIRPNGLRTSAGECAAKEIENLIKGCS